MVDRARGHEVRVRTESAFAWDDVGSRPGLRALRSRAVASQWVADDLPWQLDVDLERLGSGAGARREERRLRDLAARERLAIASWDQPEWTAYRIESLRGQLSQFLHGEQGALLGSAKIVETAPWIDAKQFAAAQAMDEARHVEVFARYLDEKLAGHSDINPSLGALLDDVLADARWDVTYLGMQVLIEGLALAAFSFVRTFAREPLLAALLDAVIRDEKRHVAFGVVALRDCYAELTARELRERQEIALEGAVRLRERWFNDEVWECLGADPRPIREALHRSPSRVDRLFDAMLFSNVVRSCDTIGLLDAGDGYLRTRFTELGVIGADRSAKRNALTTLSRS